MANDINTYLNDYLRHKNTLRKWFFIIIVINIVFNLVMNIKHELEQTNLKLINIINIKSKHLILSG